MNVKEINYGTGNRVGDTIYINKDLKKYPGLYEAVLAHEMKHTGGFKLKDIKKEIEIKINQTTTKVEPKENETYIN